MLSKKEKRRRRVEQRVGEVIDAYRSTGEQCDPQGQYTGLTSEVHTAIDAAHRGGKVYMSIGDAMPVQDADDL